MHFPPNSRDRRAISPVIGVVLLVALTIIMGTVVAAFSLTLGNEVNPDVRAGVNVEFDTAEDSVMVLFTTSEDADHLNVTVTNGSASEIYQFDQVGDKLVIDADGVSKQGVTVPDGADAFAGAGVADGDTISVVVIAVHEENSNVVFEREKQV